MESPTIFALLLLLILWIVFFAMANLLKLQRYGLEIHPLYALYKSTRLNSFLLRLGRLTPGLWRLIGNVGVVATVGEIAYLTYLLLQNLLRFFFVPEQASPVIPLIPGVTIRIESLPLFLLAAGFVILVHELSHGVQCVMEGVQIKSSAILLAVVTFGGAVEPDEESIEGVSTMSKMRIFAAGSMTNLFSSLVLVAFFIASGGITTEPLASFLQWLYFLSINLAMVNMLPIYPLDGGQMMKAFVSSMRGSGQLLQRAAMFGFLALLLSNIALSLSRFGLIPI